MPTTKSRRAAASQERRLRREISKLLGIEPDDLREWNTLICPDCRQSVERTPICTAFAVEHLPPLYYEMAPETSDGDMPLGIGITSLDALDDLLNNIKLSLMLDRISADL